MKASTPQISDYFVVDGQRGVILFGNNRKALVKRLREKEKDIDISSMVVLEGSWALDPENLVSNFSYGRLLKKYLEDHDLIPN